MTRYFRARNISASRAPEETTEKEYRSYYCRVILVDEYYENRVAVLT